MKSTTLADLLKQGDQYRLKSAWSEAAASYIQALKMDADSLHAWCGLGLASEELRQFAQANDCYHQILQRTQNNPFAHFRLGWIHFQQKKFSKALEHYQITIQQNPTAWEPLHHTAMILHQLRRYKEAIELYQRALQHQQADASLWYNTGKAFKDAGRLDEAYPFYERAIAIQPDYPEARFSLGLLHFLRGEWKQGWEGYEYRWSGWDRAGVELPPNSTLPRWQGEAVAANSRIMVFAEQGFGDSIQFFRYYTLLLQRFSHICFCVQPALVRLFKRGLPDNVEILPKGTQPILPMTHHIAMLSLPGIFGTTPDNVPTATSYLQTDPVSVARWQQRLKDTSASRIGLAWNGGKVTNIPARDMDYSFLQPLLELPNVSWICLQKENKPVTLEPIIDYMSEVADFADTADLIAALDLVITVDTAVAHLSGALGKPVWLLNRFESEWRWMYQRETTPWYPSMRIFNQPTPGDWPHVIQQIRLAISANKITK